MTLMDNAYNFYEKYIRRTPSKESSLKSGSKYGNEHVKESDDIRLTPEKRRELAHQSPIFMKGVRKKGMDSIRAWFDIVTKNGSESIKIDTEALWAFEKRSNYKNKFYRAIKDSYIYGDGFLLIQFDELDRGVKFEYPPNPKSEPRNVLVLNPSYITSVEYLSDANKAKDLYHYVYDDGEGKRYIHPDRIQHIMINEESNSKLGLSAIDIVRNTIKSKKHVDIATGKILSWFSHGLLDIKYYDLEEADKKKIKAVAETHPSVWFHDPEDFEIDIIQPQAIDPQHFMEFIVLNIASTLVMPVHVLTGIQVGRVTGAEIGFADYYRDIKDMQELIYTPLIESLYKRIIEARGRQWKYRLDWNTVYVDELGEASIMEKRTSFVVEAYQAGLITLEEGREMLNNGMIDLDPRVKPPQHPEPNKNPFKAKEEKKEEEEEK